MGRVQRRQRKAEARPRAAGIALDHGAERGNLGVQLDSSAEQQEVALERGEAEPSYNLGQSRGAIR